MMRMSALILCATIISGASAQNADVGRLFHTPEQRANLDQQRLRGISPSLHAESGGPVTLNGQVIRSSGRDTAWVNGSPVSRQEASALLPAPLKAGETAYGGSRSETRDLLNGGKISVLRHDGAH